MLNGKVIKVLAILNNGFEELEGTGTIDVLERAGYDVTLAADTKDIVGRRGIAYTNLQLLSNVNYAEYDLLFLPGGGYVPSPATNEAIQFFAKSNKYMAAICSGPTYFGKLGYLKGKNYVCFPGLNTDFGGHFQNKYVVYDKPIFTARSVAANTLLPLKIVLELSGIDHLHKLLAQMEYIDDSIIKLL